MFSKKFISATKQYGTRANKIPAPYIRKTFNLKEFSKAEIIICGLGFYEFFVNGKELTRGKYSGFISNPNDVCYYDKYDLSEELKEGKNVFGFLLGNGFLNNEGGLPWDFDKAEYRSAPKLALTFIVDGKIVFEADRSFKWAPSPVLFDDYRIGEEYDAKKEIAGWAEIDFNDSDWKRCVKAKAPAGVPKICTANPIKCFKEVKPIAHWRVECGNVYDFGANYTGVIKLNLTKYYCPHQKLIFHHGEVLVENKVLYKKNIVVPFKFSPEEWQTDIYWTKDNALPETYEPHFTYHGFRYVFIEGIDNAQATDDLLTLKVYHSEFDSESSFYCDNERVNALQEITLRSDKGNFQHFPTDCPQREKNGWMGDIGLSAEQFYYNFECKKNIREWLFNVTKAQNDKGAVPGIVPTAGWGFAWGNGPFEDFAITEVPYTDYKFHGEKEVILNNAEMIKKYFRYIKTEKRKENGLFEFGLPDWCEQRWEGLTKPQTPIEITDSLSVIRMLDCAIEMFNAVEDYAYAQELQTFADEIRRDFRKVWVDKDLFVSVKKQTAQAKALSVGIFKDKEIKQAADNLVKIIEEDGNVSQVGVIGGRVLFETLAENGYHELALKLITQSKYPSYGYWLNQGQTTLLENFYETFDNSIFRKDGMFIQSYNHHFWGFISGFFYKYIAGLKVNPKYDNPLNVVISPLIFKDIKHVECVYNKNGKTLKYEINVKDGKPVVDIKENSGFNVEIL